MNAKAGSMLLALALLAGTALVPVHAQSNPSAADIIKSLKPTGTVGSGTRGIRPVTPSDTTPSTQGAPTAQTTTSRPTAVAAARAPAAAVEPPSANLEVQFATNSSELTPSARATLDQLGKALTSSDLSAYRFRIEGHTDTVGSADQNQTLSSRRADAVVAYLSSVFHVDASHLQAVGKGEQDLAVQTGPQVPEARNRRVKVVNLGA